MSAFTKYGMEWNTADSVAIEMTCIRKHEKLKSKTGTTLFQHYKALISALWPHLSWHKWNERILRNLCENSVTGIMGPASSGKTNTVSAFALADYYCFPNETTWLISSTTLAMLDMRAWGEISKLHRKAKERRSDLPGHIINSRRMLSTDGREVEDRDFRNGIVCVACKQGSTYVGLGNYVGIKNERMRIAADELQFMPKSFVDAFANLAKNGSAKRSKGEGFKGIGLGNPKDRTDALGVLCEPADELGGWDGIGDMDGTQEWQTRYPGGRCVQLDGLDSPNAEYPRGLNPYPYLITPEDIERDIAFFGADSIQVSMMNRGRMPRDAQDRRVITRSMCLKGQAMEEAVFSSTDSLVNIGCLDAAYSGVGGDRAPFIHLQFGKDRDGKWILAFVGKPIVVPVTASSPLSPEDQIATFVKERCENLNITPEHFAFDSTGRGSLVLSLSRLWSPNVVGVEFGGKATKRPLGKIPDCSKKYRKFVSELWFATRHLIAAGQLRNLPEDVMEEGTKRAWDIFEGGYEDVETKDETKLRVGRSPDLYDTFVAGVEMARRLGFRIEGAVAPKDPARKSVVMQRHERYRKLTENFTLNNN
jgi:hypothetical protein